MRYLLVILFCLFSFPAFALIEPGEALLDSGQEARAREISKDIRCPVCESQNIENSSADVAKDLRLLIRERIKAGDTDEQVYHYLRLRYGDAVLMNPPLKAETMALWVLPFAVLLIGGVSAFFFIRKSRA